jgi:hypothetical protein
LEQNLSSGFAGFKNSLGFTRVFDGHDPINHYFDRSVSDPGPDDFLNFPTDRRLL